MFGFWLPASYRSHDRLEKLLAVWLGLSAIMAFSSAAMCFFEPAIIWERIWAMDMQKGIYLNVNVKSSLCGSHTVLLTLLARVCGLFSLMMGFLRLACAADIHNKRVFQLTMAAVALAIAHYLAEIYYFNTAVAEISSAIPIGLNIVTLVAMSFMYRRLYCTKRGGAAEDDDKDETNSVKNGRYRNTRRNIHNYGSD